MNLAPIVLFVYNRPLHTKRTLEALQLNRHIEKSTLYVFCDGPKEHSTSEELDAIKEVRAIVSRIDFCQELIISEEKSNHGLANSVMQGVSKVVKQHGKVIVLEDDIVTGIGFLEFMNSAINYYENDQTVFGVSGYKYPTQKKIKQSSYLLPIASSWSYGTWKGAWNRINFDGQMLLDKINKENKSQEMNFGGNRFYEMLCEQVKGNIDSWAIRFYASMFLEKGLFIFPKISLVQNIGFDNSGTHCKEDDFFSEVHVSDQVITVSEGLTLQEDIVAVFKKSFQQNNKPTQKKSNKLKKGLIRLMKSIRLKSPILC